MPFFGRAGSTPVLGTEETPGEILGVFFIYRLLNSKLEEKFIPTKRSARRELQFWALLISWQSAVAVGS